MSEVIRASVHYEIDYLADIGGGECAGENRRGR